MNIRFSCKQQMKFQCKNMHVSSETEPVLNESGHLLNKTCPKSQLHPKYLRVIVEIDNT